MNIFKQRKTKLFNGTIVREGNLVRFINSDGMKCVGKIERRKFATPYNETGEYFRKGTLFFWNNGFDITDYRNAEIATDEAVLST
jgi:hypothetical protein